MIDLLPLFALGRSAAVHNAQRRDGAIEATGAAGTLEYPLEPGLYVVRGERQDSYAAWRATLQLTDPHEGNPFAGAVRDVRSWSIGGDGLTTAESQSTMIAVDKRCTLWAENNAGAATMQWLIWRVGDCPPGFGGDVHPAPRSDRLPIDG